MGLFDAESAAEWLEKNCLELGNKQPGSVRSPVRSTAFLYVGSDKSTLDGVRHTCSVYPAVDPGRNRRAVRIPFNNELDYNSVPGNSSCHGKGK